MKELFINDQVIDLYPNENIALTKQCNKLNDLSDRQADYSNQFVIPPTPNNKRVCGFPNVVGSDSINPYTKLSATYIENGSELISNGIAIIEEFNGNINVTLYSGIFDFFNTIGDKSIRELPLSFLNHIYNLTNVIAGNAAGSNYVYPLIQWGATDKNNEIVDIRYQMPCVRVEPIVDLIFQEAQYQKGGDVFGFDSYKKKILPVVEDEIFNEDEVLESYSVIAHIENEKIYNNQTTPQLINFDYFGSGDAVDSSAGWYTAGRWTAQNKVSANVNFSAYIQIPQLTQVVNIPIVGPVTFPDGSRTFVELLLNGNVIDSTTIRGGMPTTLIELSSENLNMNPGDWVEVRIGFDYTWSLNYEYTEGLFQSLNFQVNKNISIYPSVSGTFSYFSVEAVNTIELNQLLDFNNLVPDIKQKDLLKDLMIIYCLVPQYDPLTRTINFIQFDKIGEYADLSKTGVNNYSVDWSSKLDLKSGYKVRYRLDGYAQSNFMKWAQDDDRAEAGTGNILINDTTLPEKTDLFTTTLAASIQETNFKGNIGVNIKRYTRVEADVYSSTRDYTAGELALVDGEVWQADEDVTGDGPPSGPWTLLPVQFEKTESVAPRLLLMRDYEDNGSPSSSTLTYTDGTTSTVVNNPKIAYFVDPLQPYDLSFQFIIDEHYQTLVRVLNKTKIVDAYFKLSDNDFKNIDFFKPVYITYFGNYFYLNQGTNYISGRLTACELVRL